MVEKKTHVAIKKVKEAMVPGLKSVKIVCGVAVKLRGTGIGSTRYWGVRPFIVL